MVNYSNEVTFTVPFSSYGTRSYRRVNILGVDFNSLQLLWNRTLRVFQVKVDQLRVQGRAQTLWNLPSEMTQGTFV